MQIFYHIFSRFASLKCKFLNKQKNMRAGVDKAAKKMYNMNNKTIFVKEMRI